MFADLFTYMRFALRRAWTQPIRSLFALFACGLAWMSLFFSLAEIRQLELHASLASSLEGLPAYQMSIKKTHQEQADLHVTVFPQAFIESTRQLAATLALQLTQTITVISADRQDSMVSKILLYEDRLPARSLSPFPPCAFVRPIPEWQQKNVLIPLASGWKCYLSEFPVAIQILQKLPDADGISFPLQAAVDVVGRDALERVEIIWLTTKHPDDLPHLLALAMKTYHLDVEMHPLSRTLAAQTNFLTQGTKFFLIGSVLLLLISLLLYVQGVYALIRREIGLRACLGAPFSQVAVWLSCDVLTQAMLLAVLSFAVAMLPQYYFVNLDISTLSTLFIYMQAGLFFLLVIPSTLLVWLLMGDSKLIVILRS